MRWVVVIALVVGAAAARAEEEPAPWVVVKPDVMEAGSVVPRITFEGTLPVAAVAGTTIDIELPYYFGLPQTQDPAADNYLSGDFPDAAAVELTGKEAPPRAVIVRATVKGEAIPAGAKFKIYLDRERVHPFDHAEVAFATIMRGPAAAGEAEGPVIARGQATVVHIPGGPPGSADEDGDRFVEIWNLVFMQ